MNYIAEYNSCQGLWTASDAVKPARTLKLAIFRVRRIRKAYFTLRYRIRNQKTRKIVRTFAPFDTRFGTN